MLIKESALAHFIGNILVKRCSMQISGLFYHHQFADYFRRRNDPCQPQPRRKQFGECAQVNNVAALLTSIRAAKFTIQRHNRGDMFALITQLTIRIIFLTDRDGNYEIYVMNADGSNPTRLTNSPGVDLFPNWSPDGKKIAFYSDRDGNGEIYVMEVDSSYQINLSNNPSEDWSPVTWSADGMNILFTSDRDGNNEIYAMNADGTDQTRLTDNPAEDVNPDWLP